MNRSTIRLLVAVVLLAAGLTCRLGADEQWETLQAIHLIENPTNSPRPGAHGELGAYQFRPGTWRLHTRKPFRLALNRAQADRVAVAHYDWLAQQLRANGLSATAYNIALAWNAGIGAVVRGRVPAASRQYAQRVVNVAGELRRSQVAASIGQRAPLERIVLTP